MSQSYLLVLVLLSLSMAVSLFSVSFSYLQLTECTSRFECFNRSAVLSTHVMCPQLLTLDTMCFVLQGIKMISCN